MKNYIKKLLLFILSCLIFSPAYALRCGNDVVQIGDSKGKVLHLCGKPAAKEQIKHKNILNDTGTVGVISKWTYNFGPNDFLYVLSFANDKVIAIDTDGYGYS